jgi:tetratricopeptide (TPR) repeat protein
MLASLASALRQAGRNVEAEAALRQSLSLEQQGSLAFAERQWELGDLLRVNHRYAEAEELMRSSLAMRKRLARSDGAEVGQSLVGLAMVQCEQGRSADSDSLFQQAIEIYRRLPTDAGGLRMPETDRAQCR